MRNIIIAALALATAGFSAWSTPSQVSQVGILTGCGTSAGTTAIAVMTPAGHNLVVSSNPIYQITYDLAKEAVVTGKNVQIESSTNTAYNYVANGSCFSEMNFISIKGFVLKR